MVDEPVDAAAVLDGFGRNGEAELPLEDAADRAASRMRGRRDGLGDGGAGLPAQEIDQRGTETWCPGRAAGDVGAARRGLATPSACSPAPMPFLRKSSRVAASARPLILGDFGGGNAAAVSAVGRGRQDDALRVGNLGHGGLLRPRAVAIAALPPREALPAESVGAVGSKGGPILCSYVTRHSTESMASS